MGRKNVRLCQFCSLLQLDRPWQPLLSLWLLHGPLISVPLREQLTRSGLRFWGAAQPYSSNSFSCASRSNWELPLLLVGI